MNIKKGDVIILYMDRSFETIISMLAIIASGAAFLPIDKKTPDERIKKIIHTAQPKFAICDNSINEDFEIPFINIDDCFGKNITKRSYVHTDGNDLAYVIFTSGSTGEPKGVMIEHLGMNNHVSEKIRLLNINRDSVVAYSASISFDISIWQVFSTLCAGGTIEVINNSTVMNVKKLVNNIIAHNISIIELVPTYILLLIDYLKRNDINSLPLKYLISTGESLSCDIVQNWLSIMKSCPIVNAYGPTEASDDVTHFFCENIELDTRIPIGKPIKNAYLSIHGPLGENINTDNKIGELWISGLCVGRGYINNLDETKKHFIYDEEQQCRIYKTGDLAYRSSSGNFYFAGRMDTQIKRHGYRIEIEEIERTIKEFFPTIEVCVFLNNLQDKLCAIYKYNNEINTLDAHEYLLNRLPEYMIPQSFIRVTTFPITINGKIDRKKLMELLDSERNKSDLVKKHVTEVCGEEFIGRNTK